MKAALLSDAQALQKRAQAQAPELAVSLVRWQRAHGRHHLPWQQTRDPYPVWLSEIMLQQTQVSTALPYFDRFMTRFPSLASLAQAPLDEVLAHWSGLGYYQRARHLHRCALMLDQQFQGQWPAQAEQLQQLPGIGPSTAAAIAAFCWGQRVSIFDGNVKRVLARVLGWAEDLAVRANEAALKQAAQTLVPDSADDMPAYTQGLMDLGATLCRPRQTQCESCPWQGSCQAHALGKPLELPVITKRLSRKRMESWWLWLRWEDHIWMVQRPSKGVWGGLWTPPLWDDEAAVGDFVGPQWRAHLHPQPAIKHVLTHMDWWLHPLQLELNAWQAKAMAPRLQTLALPGQWVAKSELERWGTPAPVRELA